VGKRARARLAHAARAAFLNAVDAVKPRDEARRSILLGGRRVARIFRIFIAGLLVLLPFSSR
jgi:hypothetical protein